MSPTKLLSLLLTIAACLVFVLATPAEQLGKHRTDTLFKKYPLHDTLSSYLSNSDIGGTNVKSGFSQLNTDEYLQKVNEAISHMEHEHIMSLTLQASSQNARSGKKPTDSSSSAHSKETKPQWFGYYYQSQKPTLFHSYESKSIVIYGTADAKSLSSQYMAHENYWPIVLGRSQRAMVAVHVTRNYDSSIGAFDEILITTHATKKTDSVLGVSYEEGNEASLLYPLFGKLPDHHRNFVLKALTSNTQSQRYVRAIHGFPASDASPIQSHIESGVKDTSAAADSSATYFDFAFMDAHSAKNIISGRVLEDNTWKSWAQSSYKIFRALGLSGIIDLWYAKHVPLKFASPIQEGAKISDHYANFRGLRIHDLSNVQLDYDTESDIGRLLRNVDFKPAMVARMPFFQYAMGAPKEQIEDMDYLTSELNVKKVSKGATEEL
uniref:Phospholipase B-like n=1 Tax=Percolomonas cosmopolitus TaxID=63605 RepID=A0A7S1PH98_9EUKA